MYIYIYTMYSSLSASITWCMHICVYVCMCMDVNIFQCICIYVCMYIYIYIPCIAYTYVFCINVNIFKYMYICMHICIYIYVYTVNSCVQQLCIMCCVQQLCHVNSWVQQLSNSCVPQLCQQLYTTVEYNVLCVFRASSVGTAQQSPHRSWPQQTNRLFQSLSSPSE